MKKRDTNLFSRRSLLKSSFWLAIILLFYPFTKFVFSLPKKRKKEIVKVGLLKDIPVGKPILKNDVWVVRRGVEIKAFYNRCTHLGCPLSFNGFVFVCRCHGSKFNLSGERIEGPAKRNLTFLKVKVTPDKEVFVKI